MRHKESVCMSKEKQEEFSLAMRHKESICESKEKQDKIFFSYHTYTRNIVIDLRIVKLIWSLSCGFSLQGERVFHVNTYVLV